ncbi:MAG: hypothetical protein M3P33_00840, partial [bacterium]|nr:hypothetical protein [bacterium]
NYHLRNNRETAIITEIALPPDTSTQKITIQSLSPKPKSVRTDDDGNLLAEYALSPGKTLDISYTGKAHLFLKKQTQKEILTKAQREIYTRPQKYWESDDLDIASLSASLKTPENIYNYVVKTLSYNKQKLQTDDFFRIGAKGILADPTNSVCMEFTDLFIALMRSRGIPARELNGYAYSRDTTSRPLSLSQDLLHAWPQYYDEERGWIQVDPTWQNTTQGIDYFNNFDLNHIVFVQKGISSEYPYPAGSYKLENSNTRDVLVSFSDKLAQINQQVKINIELSDEYISGLKTETSVTFINEGNSTITNTAQVSTFFNGRKTTKNVEVSLPPYGQVVVKPNPTTYKITDSGVYTVEAQLLEFKQSKDAAIKPFYKYSLFLIGMIYMLAIPILAFLAYFLLHNKSNKKTK